MPGVMSAALAVAPVGTASEAPECEPPERPSPSSRTRSTTFLVGQNSRGIWVVQDARGLCGGLFVDRTEALKFALGENGNRRQLVIMVPGTLELDLTPRSESSRRQNAAPVEASARHLVEREHRPIADFTPALLRHG